MNFSSKEDIDAPINHVFAMLSDFETFERAALRRGAEVERVDDLAEPGVGMIWDLSFMLRQKLRKIRLTVSEYDAPHSMCFEGSGQGIDAVVKIELVALARTRTRMAMDVKLSASTLPARLVLQSMKLGKSKLQEKFRLRIADFATELEDRYKRMA